MGTIFRKRGKWWIDYRAHGKRYRKQIGTKGDARAALSAVESRIARSEFCAPDNRFPFDELTESYMRAYRQQVRKSTYKATSYPLAHLRKDFGGRTVQEITISDVDGYRERRIVHDGVSRRTVNIEVGLLRRIMAFGVERRLIGSSPVANVKPLKEGQKRFRRALKPKEIQELLEAATDIMRPIWLAFLKTGMRKSELVELQWSDVDLDGGTIHIQGKDGWQTKTGDSRDIPIASDLLADLKRLRLASGQNVDYVFVTKNGTPRRNNLLRQLRGTARRAGVDTRGLDLHALRYTFVTELLRAGVNPKVVQSLAGHRSLRVTMQIYAQVFDADRVAAIGRLRYGPREAGHPLDTTNAGLSQATVG